VNITEIRIRRLFHEATLKAILSITLDGDFTVHDIKVIKDSTGRLFVAMPSRKDETGIYRDIAHPIDSKAREYLEACIIPAYHEHLEATGLPETASALADISMSGIGYDILTPDIGY